MNAVMIGKNYENYSAMLLMGRLLGLIVCVMEELILTTLTILLPERDRKFDEIR